jgi:5-methylcytosine-specific restriction endonuclease McrA
MSYERTPEHRAKMSAAQKGKRHSWRSASTTPKVAKKIQAWWTPERREAKRLEMLERNPAARYHGLSSTRAAEIVSAAGQCRCGSTKRLSIHHIDRDKHNQAPDNLMVLCHRCHMREHARAKETGWDVYHRKRKNPLS